MRELAAINSARREMLKKAQAALFDAAVNSAFPVYWYREGNQHLPAQLPPGQLMAVSSSGGMANLHQRGYIWRDRAAWYVYVDSDRLAEAFPLNPLHKTSVGSIPLDQLSPYLQLMIHVSLEQGMTAESRISPEELREALMAAAPKFGLSVGRGNDGSDITRTWAKELGKALRWQDARKGRAEPGTTRRS